MGNSSPTGEVPVLVKSLDGTDYNVWCDIGRQTGADLSDIVARQAGLASGSFLLIFNGRQIQDDTHESLLDNGFIASGGPSVVHLASKPTNPCVVISLHIKKHTSEQWLLTGAGMDGSLTFALEVNPYQLSLKEAHSLIADRVQVPSGQMRLVCNDCLWDVSSQGGKTLGELGGVH